MKQTKEPDIGLQIQKEAKRRWRILKRFEKQNEDSLLFAGFVVLLAAVVVINTIFVLNRTNTQPTKSTPARNDDAAIVLTSSQKGITRAFDVSISSVYESDKTEKAYAYPEDQTMLVLTISITNRTSGQKDFVPASQLFVRDDQGRTFDMHASSLVDNAIQPNTLKSGESVSGQVSFAVPKKAARPLLYVDLGWDNVAPVVFDVLK